MTIGGALFIIGAALQAGAVHLAMLIVGRVMLGLGVGLANQVRLLGDFAVLTLASQARYM